MTGLATAACLAPNLAAATADSIAQGTLREKRIWPSLAPPSSSSGRTHAAKPAHASAAGVSRDPWLVQAANQFRARVPQTA